MVKIKTRSSCSGPFHTKAWHDLLNICCCVMHQTVSCYQNTGQLCIYKCGVYVYTYIFFNMPSQVINPGILIMRCKLDSLPIEF